MKVIAAPGMKCPMENSPRSYISDAAPTDVPESAFYLRRIADGDLLRVAEEAPGKTETKAKGK